MFGRSKPSNGEQSALQGMDNNSIPSDSRTDWGYNPSAQPMMPWMNGFKPAPNRQAPSCDKDLYPRQFRNFVAASGVHDVQLHNGLRWGVASGRRVIYAGAGYLNVVVPRIPGQTRGDVAGFHVKGGSPLNYQALWQNGPGAQPTNPSGPGRINAPMYYNPMTG